MIEKQILMEFISKSQGGYKEMEEVANSFLQQYPIQEMNVILNSVNDEDADHNKIDLELKRIFGNSGVNKAELIKSYKEKLKHRKIDWVKFNELA